MTRTQNLLENGIVNQALFDDKRDVADGLNDCRQHNRLQHAHMVSDEHAWRFELSQVNQTGHPDVRADGFQRCQNLMAGLTPTKPVVLAALGHRAGSPHVSRKLLVKDQCRHQPRWPAHRDRPRSMLIRFAKRRLGGRDVMTLHGLENTGAEELPTTETSANDSHKARNAGRWSPSVTVESIAEVRDVKSSLSGRYCLPFVASGPGVRVCFSAGSNGRRF